MSKADKQFNFVSFGSGKASQPEGQASEAVSSRHFSVKKAIKRTVLLILVVFLATGSYLGAKLYADASKLTGDSNPISLISSFIPAKLNQTNGRVNILLAGYSVDDTGHQGAALTDSIMVVSIDPTTKSAVLISVPRDLYVNITGFGYSRINAAYEDGQSEGFSASGYPSGGMGLLEETLSQDLGVNFNYYALLDYSAFKDAVNAVGGISVDIQSSDPRGLYDPNTNLNLPNGEDALNGQEALNLARARGDGYGSYGFPDGDFNRTENQQLMLVALKNKADSLSVLANPITIGKLADSVANNVKTDLSIGDMETLYSDSKGIQASSIKEVTLNNYNGQNLLTDYTDDSGEDVLIPAAGFSDFSQIQSAVQSLMD
jgi:LCP family protein required for cell wall assembly